MNKDERRWHWVYTGEEFQFAEDIPFASVRYNHSWKRPEELPMHRHKFTEIVLILQRARQPYHPSVSIRHTRQPDARGTC